MPDQHLDCKSLRCPLPIVRIRKAIDQLDPDQTLLVEATDPAFEADIAAWASMTGNTLVEFHDGEVMQALIQKR